MSAASPLPWRTARGALIALTVAVLLYLVLPTLIIVPMSFSNASFLAFPPPGYSSRWYSAFASSIDYRQAVLNSVLIGVPVALLATILGTLAAVPLVRGRIPGARALSALMLAPIVLPQIVLAIGLYPIMVEIGLIGSYPAILLGHTVICTPLVFVTVSAALRSYSPSMELAAMTLGASWWRTFWWVTFPLIRPALAVGAIFAFAFSFDELILAIFLTSPTTRTLPRLLWEQLNYQMTPIIAAATTCILCLTVALLVLGAMLSRGRGFGRAA